MTLNDLPLEKQFLASAYEVVILPSLNRKQVANDILKYVRGHIKIQHYLRGNEVRMEPKDFLEFTYIKIIVRDPRQPESRLRSIALDAYISYLRSLQQLQQLTPKGSAK